MIKKYFLCIALLITHGYNNANSKNCMIKFFPLYQLINPSYTEQQLYSCFAASTIIALKNNHQKNMLNITFHGFNQKNTLVTHGYSAFVKSTPSPQINTSLGEIYPSLAYLTQWHIENNNHNISQKEIPFFDDTIEQIIHDQKLCYDALKNKNFIKNFIHLMVQEQETISGVTKEIFNKKSWQITAPEIKNILMKDLQKINPINIEEYLEKESLHNFIVNMPDIEYKKTIYQREIELFLKQNQK